MSNLDPIRFLVEQKYGIPPRARAEDDDKAAEYEMHLRSLPPHHVSILLREAQGGRVISEDFWNKPEHLANFQYWSKMPVWTLEEAVALSFGKAPETLNWRTVKNLVDCSVFAYEYACRRAFVMRAARTGLLADPISPADFLLWAPKNGIALLPELERAGRAASNRAGEHENDEIVRGLRAQIESLEKRIAELSQGPTAAAKRALSRERNMVTKLFAAQAMAYYGFNPNGAGKMPVSEIIADLDRIGLKVDRETVGKYLSEGIEQLPSHMGPADGKSRT